MTIQLSEIATTEINGHPVVTRGITTSERVRPAACVIVRVEVRTPNILDLDAPDTVTVWFQGYHTTPAGWDHTGRYTSEAEARAEVERLAGSGVTWEPL